MILLRIVMHTVCGQVVIISYLAFFFQAILISPSKAGVEEAEGVEPQAWFGVWLWLNSD
jgi:hypothetical protein